MATMATRRRKGKQFRSSEGIDALAGVHAKATQTAEPHVAHIPISSAIVDGKSVVTFDPSLVVPDEQTTPDLDAREAGTRTKRRPKGPPGKPTNDASVEAPPPASPPPSDPT
jgi:hypothetical protein